MKKKSINNGRGKNRDKPPGPDEQSLKETSAREWLAQALEGIAVPTFIIDRDHRVIYWNRACERLTGILAKDIVGTRNHWTAYYSVERPTMADIILLKSSDIEISTYYSKWRKSKVIEGAFEAEEFFPELGIKGTWLYFTASPMLSRDGTLIGAIETLQDISKRKIMEEVLKKNQEHLEVLVYERTMDLENTNEQLLLEIQRRKIVEEELQRIAITDPLTQIYNRKKFNESVDIEIKRSLRYSNDLSLLMFDIDHFKKVNDTHGHDTGDRVIVEIVRCVKESIREINIFARWGGEEFVVLLPDTDKKEAVKLAERLRQKIEENEFAPVGRVTCSFGVTQFHAGDDRNTIIKRTDTALYIAKNRGRNRVAHQ